MNYDNAVLPPLEAGHKPVWIFWDLYKTLCRATYPEPIKEFQQILGYKPSPALTCPAPEFLDVCLTTASKRVRDAFHQERRLVEEDPDEYAYLVASRFGLSVPQGAGEAFRKLIENEKNGLAIFLDVKKQLRALRSMGYKQALLSNTWPFPIPSFLSEDPDEGLVLDDFDELVMSYEVGIAKPNPQFYLEAARRCGTHPGNCMMIGDNPVLDVRASMDVGMRAVHLDRYGDCKDKVPGVPVISKICHLYAPANSCGS